MEIAKTHYAFEKRSREQMINQKFYRRKKKSTCLDRIA